MKFFYSIVGGEPAEARKKMLAWTRSTKKIIQAKQVEIEEHRGDGKSWVIKFA